MRKSKKENIIVVCTIVLCFMLTLGLCTTLSGEGFIGAFAPQVEKDCVYAITIGGYKDITLARNSAELIKQRGGAGYVKTGDEIEIIYAVYPDEQTANDVLATLGDKSAYIKGIELSKAKLSWCEKEHRDSVSTALNYYGIAFDVMYDTANKLGDSSVSIQEANTQIKVLRSRIEDIKSDFYKNVNGYNDERITQIKLALVTTLALIDNIGFEKGIPSAVSDIRYQAVQLVFCRQALMQAL